MFLHLFYELTVFWSQSENVLVIKLCETQVDVRVISRQRFVCFDNKLIAICLNVVSLKHFSLLIL